MLYHKITTSRIDKDPFKKFVEMTGINRVEQKILNKKATNLKSINIDNFHFNNSLSARISGEHFNITYIESKLHLDRTTSTFLKHKRTHIKTKKIEFRKKTKIDNDMKISKVIELCSDSANRIAIMISKGKINVCDLQNDDETIYQIDSQKTNNINPDLVHKVKKETSSILSVEGLSIIKYVFVSKNQIEINSLHQISLNNEIVTCFKATLDQKILLGTNKGSIYDHESNLLLEFKYANIQRIKEIYYNTFLIQYNEVISITNTGSSHEKIKLAFMTLKGPVVTVLKSPYIPPMITKWIALKEGIGVFSKDSWVLMHPDNPNPNAQTKSLNLIKLFKANHQRGYFGLVKNSSKFVLKKLS